MRPSLVLTGPMALLPAPTLLRAALLLAVVLAAAPAGATPRPRGVGVRFDHERGVSEAVTRAHNLCVTGLFLQRSARALARLEARHQAKVLALPARRKGQRAIEPPGTPRRGEAMDLVLARAMAVVKESTGRHAHPSRLHREHPSVRVGRSERRPVVASARVDCGRRAQRLWQDHLPPSARARALSHVAA